MYLTYAEHLRTKQIADTLSSVRAVAVVLPPELRDDEGVLSAKEVSLIARLGTGVALTGVAKAALDVVDEVAAAPFLEQMVRLRREVGDPQDSPALFRVKFVRAKAVEIILCLSDRFREMAAAKKVMGDVAGAHACGRTEGILTRVVLEGAKGRTALRSKIASLGGKIEREVEVFNEIVRTTA